MMGMDYAHKKFRQINFQKVSISANEIQFHGIFPLFQPLSVSTIDFTKYLQVKRMFLPFPNCDDHAKIRFHKIFPHTSLCAGLNASSGKNALLQL